MADVPNQLIDKLIAHFDSDKKYGKGTFLRLSSEGMLCDVDEWVSTGSTLLDYAIGYNEKGAGIPVGRLTEIFGETGEGKSTLATHILANVQKMGGIGIFMDTENAMNKEYAQELGLDEEKLVYVNPGHLQEGFGEIEDTITFLRSQSESKDVPVAVVLDSFAGLAPKEEIEGEYGDHHVGLQARLASQAMRKIMPLIAKQRIFFVITNQVRYGIGGYGDNMTQPGGRAIPFHSSVRLHIRRKTWLEQNNIRYGLEADVQVVKNKVAAPFKRVAFHMLFHGGIQDYPSFLPYLLDRGYITASGAWYKIKDPKGELVNFQSRKFYDEFCKDPEWQVYLKGLVMETYGIGVKEKVA